MKRLAYLTLCAAVMMLAACGSGGSSTPTSAPAASSSGGATATPPPTAEPEETPLPPSPTSEPAPALQIEEVIQLGTGLIRSSSLGTHDAQSWSPDSTRLAVATTAGVYIYNMTDPEAEPVFLSIENRAVRVAYSPDGTRLVVTEDNANQQDPRYIRFYDAETLELVNRVETYRNGPVGNLEFSRDSTRLMGGGITLHEWDLATGEELTAYYAFDIGNASVVGISPDNSRVYFANSRNEVYEYNRDSAEAILLFALDAPSNNRVTDITISPDGARLAAVGSQLEIWDIERAEVVATYAANNAEGVEWVDDTTVIVSRTTAVEIYDLETGEMTSVAISSPRSPRLSPDRSMMTSTREFRLLQVFDVTSRAVMAEMPFNVYSSDVVVAPDGSWFAGYSASANRIDIFDSATYEIIAALPLNGQLASSDVRSVAVSPDGSLLAAVPANRLQIFSTETWEQVGLFNDVIASGASRSIAFSPDGTRLTVMSSSNTVPNVLLEIRDGGESIEQIAEFPPPADFVRFATFSPDGSRVVGMLQLANAYLWDVGGAEIGEPQITPYGNDLPYHFVYLPDGGLIVTGGASFITSSYWARLNPDTLEVINRVPGEHRFRIYDAAVTEDGARMVTVGEDQVIRLWDLVNDRLLAEWRVLNATGQGVALLEADGSRFITVGDDLVLRVWQISE